MRRWPIVVLLVLGGATAAAAVAAAATAPAGGDRGGRHLFRGGYFAVACGFSHRNQDDPIVFPGQSGRSHDHTYFGNTSTNASSTPASLRAAGETTCRLRRDTAAYWAPTLYVRGNAIEPRGAIVYYVRRTIERVQPFPAGLEVIAGNAAAPAAQSMGTTYWSCGGRGGVRASSTIPTCSGPSLRLQVTFPNCWDGSRLDSADHKSHMAYSSDGVCPASHPVEVPTIHLQIHYGVAGGPGSELSSGGEFSGHADFVKRVDQQTLARLVDGYLNREGRRR